MQHALRPDLAAVAGPQQGLFTRRQALDACYSADEIRALLAPGGAWAVVRRGVYFLADAWAAGTELERARWADLAAHLQMHTWHLMSHDSAARMIGVPLVGAAPTLVHITRPGVGGSRTRHGVKHHLGRELPADTSEWHGVPVTGPARTALDIAREHGFASGVVAIDSVLHRGVSRAALERELARMANWPFVRTSRAAAAFADGRAESPGESLTRILVAEVGLGPIDLQFPVPTRSGTRWCDLRVGRHLIEFDGRIKYLPRQQGGVADRDPSEVAWRDRLRDTDITTLGLGVSHLTWADLHSGREAARSRLLREEAATRLRFGTELPDDLVHFAREHARSVGPRRFWAGAV